MKHALQIMAVSGLLAWGPAGNAQNLSLPDYMGRPESDVVMPLTIDDASGLAGIRIAVNFDPSILELETVQRGPLGSLYDLVWQQEDGVLNLFLAREDALVSGSGRLVCLKFRVNAGAETNLYSDLTIADFELSDESGVVALDRQTAATSRRGRLTVTDSSRIDNAGNGLPDEWELAVGLDPFEATADGDPDLDGLPNAQEEQLGLNPTKADTDGDGVDDRAELIAGTDGNNNDDYLALDMELQGEETGPAVFRWRSVTGRVYSILFSTNLMVPWPSVPWRVVVGDGTDKSFTNESEEEPFGYFRLKVEEE